MTLEGTTYAATVEWVEKLVAESTKLQATKYEFYTLDGQLWIQVQGGTFEAHAWQAAVGGRALGSSVRSGVRRQVIIGARVCVEVIDDPRKRTETGRMSLWLVLVVAGVGFVALGLVHPSGRLDPAVVVDVLGVGGALALGWVLQATVRGYWRLDRRGKAATEARVKATRQSAGNAHHQDAAS